ncbi:hypothetical protein DFH09DRAFT_1295197 [Mycena vulgaris]|nr:hypothetical protein DFH09DRAFT_1295197 [Mycena vulgaris]
MATFGGVSGSTKATGGWGGSPTKPDKDDIPAQCQPDKDDVRAWCRADEAIFHKARQGPVTGVKQGVGWARGEQLRDAGSGRDEWESGSQFATQRLIVSGITTCRAHAFNALGSQVCRSLPLVCVAAFAEPTDRRSLRAGPEHYPDPSGNPGESAADSKAAVDAFAPGLDYGAGGRASAGLYGIGMSGDALGIWANVPMGFELLRDSTREAPRGEDVHYIRGDIEVISAISLFALQPSESTDGIFAVRKQMADG